MRDDSLSTAIARAGMAHRARAAALLAEVGLHPGQEFLLGILWRSGPCSVGVLADELGVEQPTVTKMVNRMAAAGFVARDRDPADARRVLVRATEEGSALRERVDALWDRLDAETAAGLSEDEAAQATELLLRIRRNLATEASEPESSG